jgi:hypothetical protein
LRIAAQKALNIPESVNSTDLDRALSDLYCGHQNATLENFGSYKENHKWGGKPAITLQNDYSKLLVALFSEENEVSRKYREDSKNSQVKIRVPKTKLDKAKEIWKEMMPHRKLVIEKGKIQTKSDVKDSQPYHASEMSDGERVVFYLIGQCLSAPKNGVIVVDEPELHLHKSIQYTLWNKIERERSDCIFVYLTHDIEFAVSRNGFKKIWLKNYDGTNWEWDKLEENTGVPEELSLEVYGSRRKVLLVEGENGREDVRFYQNIFEDFLIKPCGSCEKVIEYTKSFRGNKEFHSLEIFGLIDRDRRIKDEIESLESRGIYSLRVAEVENIFATPEIIKLVSDRLCLEPSEQQKKTEEFVFSELEKELDKQILERKNDEIKFILNGLDLKNRDGSLVDFIESSIDEEDIHKRIEDEFKEIIKEKDYLRLLEYYNRKTIASRIGNLFGMKKDELPAYVVRMSKDNKLLPEIKNAVLNYFPEKLAKIIDKDNKK